MTTTAKHLLSEIVAGLDGVPTLLKSRIGSEFDGECHLTEKEALAIAAYVEQIEKALDMIAARKLTSEIEDGELVANDIEGAHDAMVLTARAALGGSNE